jgi:ubiquitin
MGAKKKTGTERTAKVKRKTAKRPASRAKGKGSARTQRKPEQRRLPYVQCLERGGPVSVWLVDGAYVRKNLDEEFSNFGHHYSCSAIPQGEVWLDQEAVPDEQRFFLHHALAERELMAQGKDYDTAREEANRQERQMRLRAGDVRKLHQGKKPLRAALVHERLWKALDNGVQVWFVKGRLVRSMYDVEFTEGGHDCVYEFVPQNEVWIDDDVHEEERGFILFHELHERNLMANGMDYDTVHDDASRLERHYRNRPAELHEALAREGWE